MTHPNVTTPAASSASDYWFAGIDEDVAAPFVGVKPTTLQAWRQRGVGPPYIRVSLRCVRYRRIDLREWAELRLQTRTGDST